MKLSKQIKLDLAKAYQCVMEISILDMKAPLRYINQYIAEDISGYGTAADEKVKSRKDYRRLVMTSRKQSRGMLFKAKINTPYRPKFRDETTAQFQDEMTVQIGDNKNRHIIHLWMSTVFKYRNNKWQMVLFHGSAPDASSSSADTFHIREAEKKVKELEKIVAQRTLDLQRKNRELEIETSLERVRAVTMAMNKPGDILNICKVFFTELQVLGFKNLRNALINFWDDENGLLHDYDYSDYAGGNYAKLAYNSHPAFQEFQKKIRKAKDAFAKLVIEKDGLKSWQQRRRNSGEYKDPRLNKIAALYYYFYSTGVGALGISTFSPISKDEVEVLKKFRNVFDLTYLRYLDIEKAAAQVRAAQIELSVERVRAKSLAMHSSTQILEVVDCLKNEMISLQIPGVSAATIYLNEEDGYKRMWDLTSIKKAKDGFHISLDIKFKLEDSDPAFYLRKLLGAKEHYTIIKQDARSVANSFKWLRKYNPQEAKSAEQFIKKNPIKKLFHPTVKLANGKMSVDIINTDPPAEMEFIMTKMGAAFDLAYKRFLDLQESEARAKESKIELSLERVRARTMSMQRSEELPDAANVLFQQVQSLGMNAWSAGYCIWDDDKQAITLWMSSAGIIQKPFRASTNEDPSFIHFLEAWKRGETFYVEEIGGKQLISHYKYMRSLPVVGEMLNKFIEEGGSLPVFQIYHLVFFSKGFLLFITYEPVPEAHDIFKRFGNVFEQTYTRFLDLQKAEAQTREAKIEAALEKVRSRSLAMHNSSELSDVVKILLDRLNELDVKPDSININIVKEDQKSFDTWFIAPGYDTPMCLFTPYFDHPVMNDIAEAVQSRKELHSKTYSRKIKDSYFNYLYQYTAFKNMPAERKKYIMGAESWTYSVALARNTSISTHSFSGKLFSAAEHQIIKRFVKVLEQTYTRFLDLQKAEAQAKEAHIETALEKVRSRSLAMQKSEELKEVIQVVYEQFVHLNVNTEHTGFVMDYKERDDRLIWVASKYGLPTRFTIPYFDSVYYNRFNEAKEKGWDFFATNLSFEEKNNFYKELFNYIPEIPEEDKKFYFSCPGLAISTVLLENVGLYIENFEGIPYSDEDNGILMRFGKVFQQTYTRFLDLQKAEAQTKEAQIEAALEKVRSRTMAMQSSNELQETATVLFNEFKKLGTEDIYQVTIGIYNEDEGLIDFRVTSWAGSGEQENRSFKLDMNESTVLQPTIEAWRANKKSLVIDLTGETLEGWLNYRNKMSGITVSSADTAGRRVITVAYYSKGHLSISTPVPVPADTLRTLERFAAVFDSTYTRFLDLKKAEAQARESQIEAALERVRSRTLAMQKSDELSDTAAELFKQLIGLGIEPNRLYIGIVNGDTKDMEMWATDKDGTGVGKKFTFNAADNASVKKLYDGWKNKVKSVAVDMQGNELENYISYLKRLKIPLTQALTQKRRVQSVAYFDKGFIGMASPDEQSEKSIHLLERFAAVFNLTFTRFNDLKIAEAHALQAEQDLIEIKEAKQKAEEAFFELQATQKQLVQSEKMASLGELTAGIAHEIQNPLNFVNNFSEVSKELLDEMKEAIEKGDTEEAKEIMNDVIQNLEKINHHGKRADGIVKGMLQHSRSSNGVKEPTDINALCDEYVRLSYHGLRAKDKSFNATIKTDFDTTIGSITIISQDIGRVILNLLTNAFYAVNEKRQQKIEGYEPTVSISTKKMNNTVFVSVKDNGNGIPSKVLDKIFQPFFTTKPTGQGTGLGLSLSYDIVTKGHGGELKVETKENEGTTFIIQLPGNNA